MHGFFRKMHRVAGWVGCGVLLWALCGCESPRSDVQDRLAFSVSGANEIRVADKPVTVEDLPDALKAQGATLRTQISVMVAEETSKAVMVKITRRLASAGFSRVTFCRPRRAVAEFKSPAPVRPSASRGVGEPGPGKGAVAPAEPASDFGVESTSGRKGRR